MRTNQTLKAWRAQVREIKETKQKVEAGGRRAGEALAGTILFPLDVASSVVKTVSSLLPGGSATAKWRALCSAEGLDVSSAEVLLALADGNHEDAIALAVKGGKLVKVCVFLSLFFAMRFLLIRKNIHGWIHG